MPGLRSPKRGVAKRRQRHRPANPNSGVAWPQRKRYKLRQRKEPINATVWLSEHLKAFFEQVQRLSGKSTSLLNCLLIGIALTLPSTLFLGLENIRQLLGHWQDEAHISLFLKAGNDSNQFAEKLAQHADIADIQVIDKEQALREFRTFSGLGEILDGLGQNPFPDSLLIRPKNMLAERGELRALETELQSLPQVESVHIDGQWLTRLRQGLILSERLLTLFSLLLLLGLLLVITNTVRIEVSARLDEIQLQRLLGASLAYIRRPLLYLGFWHGLGGGLIACVMLMTARLSLQEPADSLAALYESRFAIEGLGYTRGLALLAFSSFLGVSGSWLASSYYLRKIEPKSVKQ